MVCTVSSLGLQGVQGYGVDVECSLSSGLPAFDVVGLPDAAVKEARERVRSAVRASGFDFPVSRITINLAPADRKKNGTVYDLPILVGILAAGGQIPFQGMETAAFLGERQQISYGALVQTFCGVSLPKTESLTDWSRRPLTDKQIEYAIDDVKYLIVAYTEMMSRLRELGRVDWVLDELRPLADESHYRADRHEAFRKVKRINSCSRHQLGIARELAAWREDRAERRNIPRKWVMSDDTLLALVKRNPVRVEEFRSIRGTDQLGERDVDGALMAIKRGASCPHDRLPLLVRGHRQISPELESVTDLMYALIRLVAERSGVATSVIASRDDLADYIEHPEQSRLREGWRFELVGSRLDDLLSGNMGLTVKDGKIELL